MTAERETFRKICLAVDNARGSEAAIDAAVSLARTFGAQLVGTHVYAAGLHERRFKQMEYTLPSQYLSEHELERQRSIHSSLINLGLELISNCYLDVLQDRCRREEVLFQRKTFDGRNWERLVEDIEASDYDLVVMRDRGHGMTGKDLLGSVCLRVTRRVRTDTLVIKSSRQFEEGDGAGIVAAIDGSAESFGGLQVAIALARAYNRPIEAVAAYDRDFHYRVFHHLLGVLSAEAARVFRFKEQERLHEEIIDSGLARIYQSHLEVARRLAREQGVELTTTLLAGRPDRTLVEHLRRARPWLLVVGRIGVHSDEAMDIGSTTENLLRLARCNVLIASRRLVPGVDLLAEAMVVWTEDGRRALDRLPSERKSPIQGRAHQLALERGHTVVTADLVAEAASMFAPRREQRAFMGTIAHAVALDAIQKNGRAAFLCRRCGYAAWDDRPELCPTCATAEEFVELSPPALERLARARGSGRDGAARSPDGPGKPRGVDHGRGGR